MKAGIVTLAMLIANLLLPQEIVIRPACCYDEDGQVRLCSEPVSSSEETIQAEGCCTVRKIDLKTPMPALDSGGRQTVSQPVLACTASMLPVGTAPAGGALTAVFAASAQGPPGHASLLTIHSRLNL